MTRNHKPAAAGPGRSSAARLRARPWIALALAAAVLVPGGCIQRTQDQPAAVRGAIDLSAWDFSSKGPVDLDGEWEFYWNRFLSPEEFSGNRLPAAADYISMPGFWNDRAISGQRLPGHGFATMRLTVRLDSRQPPCSIKIPHMYTAYRLWVNGSLVSSNGITGIDAAHETPQFLPKTATLNPDSGVLELLVHISNFHHPKGGMWSSIQLGMEEQISGMQRQLIGFNFFLLGGLLLMAIYHISIFLFRKTDRASLFFGILCLVMALRVPFEGERLIIELFPWIGWEINEKISYLTFYVSPIIINLYIYYLFPGIYSRALVRISTVIGLVFCFIIIVLTSQYYYYTRYAYHAYLAFWALYDIYVITRAVMMKKEGAAYLIGGMLIMLATACIDILYHERIINFGNVSSLGVFIFTMSQAMVLSDRSAKAFARIETLSSEKAHLFASSIDIISSILLASSTRLYEFTQNVARISVLVARHAGIPADGIDEIRIAALLHDIGMMGLPDDLATRQYPISDSERQIIENHPRKSIEIIYNLKELAGVKLIIAQHHERYNGSGYPSGLAGKDIAAGARIIGLVDDFVSMLGRREFQVEDKKNKIIGELSRQKGVLYDPDLADTLIRLIEKKNLVYIINENDIRYEKRGDVSEWKFPSNVNYEMSVVGKIDAEIKSRAVVSREKLFLIESGLGEIIRNAIIHGNKYDESKQVTVKLSLHDPGGRTMLRISVSDQGSGMDFTRYNHYKENRFKLYTIMREMKEYVPSVESAGARDVLDGLSMKLQGFLMDNYISYNQYRQIDSPEATGGIGLIQVMQSFDNVDFRPIIVNHALCGMEVVLEKYID